MWINDEKELAKEWDEALRKVFVQLRQLIKLKTGFKDKITKQIKLDKDDLLDIKELFKLYIEQGLSDHVEIIDKIHNNLKGVLDITKEQLRDEISGYSKLRGEDNDMSVLRIDKAILEIKTFIIKLLEDALSSITTE